MNSKMRSCVMGLLLGQFSSPLPEVQKEPVAYLYNGVRLPKLPEWDRETYPYVWMNRDEVFGRYRAFYAMSDVTFIENTNGGTNLLFSAKYLVCSYDSSSAVFTDWNVVENDNESNRYIGYIGWSNFDLTTHDGTLYLAASEPIPVYE